MPRAILLCALLVGCGGNDGPPDAMPACVLNSHCNDQNDCTYDTCVNGSCVFMTDSTLEGEACNDGLACTTLERCTAGVCTGDPLDCASMGDQCNTGVCMEAAGGCVLEPLPNGTTCDDGTYCSSSDTCTSGTCAGGPRDCSAFDDACNVGTCDEDTLSCVATPVLVGTGCDDGNFCTDDDSCNPSGVCAGGPPHDCTSEDDACNVGTCDEASDSCLPVPANEGGNCDDGLFCTDGDTCTAGACSGPPRNCVTGSACLLWTCDDGIDMCVSEPAMEGGPCDDGLACTSDDTCTLGTCSGATPTDCTSYADTCNLGLCDEGMGGCYASPTNEGGLCDDGLFCSNGDACSGGTCLAAGPLSCADTQTCTTDSCDEDTNMCLHATSLVDATSLVSSSSTDGTPLTACMVAGSQASVLVWTDLRDTAGAPVVGAAVTIGGTAAISSVGQPGVYYREITAASATGNTTVSVVATYCGNITTLSSSVTLQHVAANATDGGTGGCAPGDGNVRVKVIAAETGLPISGASVLIGAAGGSPFEHGPDARFGGASSPGSNVSTTDATGFARFRDYGSVLAGPVMVTAGAANRAYFTVAGANASDLVLALPLTNPPALATTVYGNTATSTSTWPPTGCNDIDMGIALPKLQLDFFSSLDISSLFTAERCWDTTNGLVGVQAIPGNVFLPTQSIGPLCLGGSLAQAPWSLALKNTAGTGVTENVDLIIASAPYNDVQTALASGGVSDLLSILIYRRIGFVLNETVPTAPTDRSVIENETYPNNFVVTYSGRPADADIVGMTAGDYAGTNGTGSMFLLGSAVHEWNAVGSSVTIPNSDLNATGGGVMMPPGVRRLASVSALYLDPADAGRTTPPPANRADAVSTVMLRGTAAGPAPFGTTGGSATASSFLALAGTTFTAPTSFQWENTGTASNSPLYSVHELTVRSNRYLPVLTACQTTNEIRNEHSVQWIVVKPYALNCGVEECFTLPTLPATFPRAGNGVQRKSGFAQLVGSGAPCTATCAIAGESCVDPDAAGAAPSMCMAGAGTAANPYQTQRYQWGVHAYDLELAPSFSFDAFRFNDRINYMTHESSNSAPFN